VTSNNGHVVSQSSLRGKSFHQDLIARLRLQLAHPANSFAKDPGIHRRLRPCIMCLRVRDSATQQLPPNGPVCQYKFRKRHKIGCIFWIRTRDRRSTRLHDALNVRGCLARQIILFVSNCSAAILSARLCASEKLYRLKVSIGVWLVSCVSQKESVSGNHVLMHATDIWALKSAYW
jgi:hypothetical protein